jgi:hypothetical protein
MCEQRASLAIVDFDRDLGARTLEVSRASIRCGKYRVLEDQYSHDANDNGPASLNKSAGVARITAMLLLMGRSLAVSCSSQPRRAVALDVDHSPGYEGHLDHRHHFAANVCSRLRARRLLISDPGPLSTQASLSWMAAWSPFTTVPLSSSTIRQPALGRSRYRRRLTEANRLS